MNKLTSKTNEIKRNKQQTKQNIWKTKPERNQNKNKKIAIYRITYLSMESFTSFQNNLFVP